MTLSKEDIRDADIVDAVELLSSGATQYMSLSVVSTATAGSVVTFSLPSDHNGLLLDHDRPAQVGDILVLSGTSGGSGDGSFVIASIPSDTTVTVAAAIGNSTGGTASFRHPPGAGLVGFAPAGQAVTVATNVQQAMIDIANAIPGGGDSAWRRHFLVMGG